MTQIDQSPSAPITVMILEPDIIARMVIADYLRGCGFKVIEGAAAQDAFEVLREGVTVDIIFAEVNLPGEVDGFHLSKKIKEAHPGIDVILTSSIAKAAAKAGDLCDEGPLGKPYHREEVVRRIKILRARRG